MQLSITTFLIVCPLVFLAGFIDSIAGGGGLISLPAYLLAGIPSHYAIATNKVSSSFGTTVSTFRYLKNRYVIKRLILPTVVLALIGSFFGANLSLRIDEKYLQYIMIVLLPIIALFFLIKKDSLSDELKKESISIKNQTIIACVAAFLIGAYDGFYGPGTGTFLVIVFTSWANMDTKTANGNAKCINLASNISALVTYLVNGKALLLLGLVAAIFNMLGNYFGSGIVLKSGSKIVRPMVFVILVLLLMKIIAG